MIRNTAEVRPYPAATHSIAPLAACRPDWIDGSATLTMKKSSTTMNVPDRTTGSGAQRLPRASASDCGNLAVICVVLMPSKVAVQVPSVDYLRGNLPGS